MVTKKTAKIEKKPVKKTVVKPAATAVVAPPDPKPASKGKYIETVGRRKTAGARIKFFETAQEISFLVNNQPLEAYFPKGDLVNIAKAPLVQLNISKYAIVANAFGGGSRGQAEAIRLALSRALVTVNDGYKKELKGQGFLTRDPRMKERKKPGLKKARRAAQWSKR